MSNNKDLAVTKHGYTAETFAIASLLVGSSYPFQAEERRNVLRGFLDQADQDSTYDMERFDRAQALADFLADLLRALKFPAEEARK